MRMPFSYCSFSPHRLIGFSIPYHHVRAHNELWLGVPLVVGDIVMGLEPDPLLSFGQKPVAAWLPFAKLHHCQQKIHTACSTICDWKMAWNVKSVTKASMDPLIPKGGKSLSTFWVTSAISRMTEQVSTSGGTFFWHFKCSISTQYNQP